MKKSIPKGHILCDSIYSTFLKRQNYRNGEQIMVARSLEKKVWEKDGYGYKRAIEVILVGMELSVLCLYQCQYPAGDFIV